MLWGFPPGPWVPVAGAGLAGRAVVAALCPWQPGVLLGDVAAGSFGGDRAVFGRELRAGPEPLHA